MFPTPARRSSVLAGCLAVLAQAAAGCGGAVHGHAARHTITVASGRACPGAARCPYSSVSILGRRGEGVLRFPEALALAGDGDVYVADQYSYVVQRFSPAGRFLGQWGTHGAGPGQFGVVGGLAVSHTGDVYLVDSEHDRIEEFDAG